MLFAVFDTETTGLLKHRDVSYHAQPRVIEFAGIITDGEEIIDTTHFLVNPGEQLEAIITKITGLTDERLRDELPMCEHFTKLSAFFSQASAAIAHNMSFDKGMIFNECERVSVGLFDISWPRIEICTVEQTMPLFGRRMKLGELYERAVGPIKDAHTALGDVKMLHEVCRTFGIYDSLQRAYA